MEIQTEDQAAKVRAVMASMITKLQEAKASGEKELAAQLKAQYTTLQTALQEYKARERDAKAEQRDMVQAYRDMNTQLKDNVKELENDLEEARAALAPLQEQLATARKTIGMLKTEVSRLDDENRSLRSPPPVEEYRKAQVMPTATAPTFNMADLMRDIDTFAAPNT